MVGFGRQGSCHHVAVTSRYGADNNLDGRPGMDRRCACCSRRQARRVSGPAEPRPRQLQGYPRGDGAPHRIQARSTWTSCAVSAFQRRTPGLKVDGIVGPANAAAMRLKRAAAQPATTDGGRRGVVSPSLDAVAGACRLRRPGVRHLRCHLRRGHRETGRRIVGLRAEIHADHLTVEVDDGTTARARLRK